MFYSLSGSVGLSPLRALNWFIFIIILVESKLGTRMMQESALFPILPQNFQMIFCQTHRDAITK